MNRQALLAVMDYYHDIPDPRRHLLPLYFKQRSYSRWAVMEILELLHRYPKRRPSRLANDFAKRMERHIDEGENTKDIFNIALETARDIECLLLAMGC